MAVLCARRETERKDRQGTRVLTGSVAEECRCLCDEDEALEGLGGDLLEDLATPVCPPLCIDHKGGEYLFLLAVLLPHRHLPNPTQLKE